jgi:CRP-like cAMP-binding protein
MMVADIAELVASHPVLEGLPGDTARLVGGCARNIAVAKGELLLAEGEPAETLYLLRRGRVSLEMRCPGQDPLVIDIMGPGTALGWSWLFPPYRWRFDARAMDSVGAIAVDAQCFRTKLESDPVFAFEITKRFASILLERLQATGLRLLDLYRATPAEYRDASAGPNA